MTGFAGLAGCAGLAATGQAQLACTRRHVHDPLVMAEHRLAGEAFAGLVTAAPDHLDDSGRRRKLRPLVTVRTQDSPRIDAGAALVSPSRPGQQARVVSVTALGERRTEVLVELSGGMGRRLTPEPGSVPEPGERLCYTTLTDSFQPSASFPGRAETPWTHGGPPPDYLPSDEDAAEAWS